MIYNNQLECLYILDHMIILGTKYISEAEQPIELVKMSWMETVHTIFIGHKTDSCFAIGKQQHKPCICCSIQCPATGVTKPMVCTILSVECCK